MVIRITSANASGTLEMDGAELKQSIKASEGRTVLSKSVVTELATDSLTTSEAATAFEADLILLNLLGILDPKVSGLTVGKSEDAVKQLQKLTGRLIGVNLEPVDESAEMGLTKLQISAGRVVTVESMKAAEKLGFDSVCFIGNPGIGVTNKVIARAVKTAKENFSGLTITGKMHGVGVDESVTNEESVKAFLDAGADVALAPAIDAVPGFTSEELIKIVKIAREYDGLVISTIEAGRESSGIQAVYDITLQNKICGVDIQHIGDAGWGIVSPTETIFGLSKTIRGTNHTISRMAHSVSG